jgi:hypothetical protein
MNLSKMPNSLSLALAESALFLRAVHVHQTQSSHENAPPAILRGLLVLSLAKHTRISSIQAELVAQSVTVWTEVMAIWSTFSAIFVNNLCRTTLALPRRVAGEEQHLFCYAHLLSGPPFYHWPAFPLPRSRPLLLRRP